MTQSRGTLTPLRVYLFGHFRVEREEKVVRLPTRHIRSLLAYLVLRPGSHSREKLAALFWPDVPDDSARASLRNALYTLRRKLGRQLLQADRQTAQINSSFPLWVDALTFKTQATRFLNGPLPDPNAVNLELYTGQLLEGFYDDWVLVEREAFRNLYLETLLDLTQRMRSQSEYERAVEFAEMALACDRANERAHQHMIVCHVALGNRGAALSQYEACRMALRDELAVEPSAATKNLHEWIQQAPAERLPVEAALTNLPIPPTTFIGRRSEIASVKKLLSSVQLLTLTGAGGSGKTRLAIQVASDLLDAYIDGVWWVALAPLAEGNLLPRAVAKALGAPEVPGQKTTDTLVNFLRPKNLLLVLDNCEHLIAASARLVKRLLGECPQLKVLATSREALSVAGEQIWPVETLSAPDPQQPLAPDQLLQYEAVHLFAGRAQAVRPDFTLTEENARPVAEICRRLDGLPLAIELAAARANVLAVDQIAARLDDAFQLLTAGSRTALPRHQTLRAAFDWSYDLLTEEEKVLLRRLSVFAGGWTLSAVEAICAGEGIAENEVFDLLSRLVDKSLVEVHPGGERARYRMLETIRQYSSELLLESGESGSVRARHLNYFTRLVEAADPHLGFWLPDRDRDVWLRRLEAEYDNLRTAVRWIFEAENGLEAGPQAKAEAGLRLAVNLHWFWFARARFSEGRSWLTRLIDTSHDVSATMRAQALATAGYMACWQGEFASGRSPLEDALTLFRQLEEGSGIAYALHGLGLVALSEGHVTLGRSRFKRSLGEAREADDRWLTAFSLHFLAIALSYQGKYARALSYLQEGDAIREQLGGMKQGRAFSLFHRARIARHQGDYAAARSRHAQGMQLFQQTGDRRGIGYSLAGFAILAAAQGDVLRAARLSGALASLERVLGSFLDAPLQIEFDRELAAVRAALDEEAFAEATAEGRAMTMEQAAEYALEQYDEDLSSSAFNSGVS